MNVRWELVPVLVSLVEGVKSLFKLDARVAFAIAVAIAFSAEIGMTYFPDIAQMAINAVVLALAGAGLYSGGKRVGQYIKS